MSRIDVVIDFLAVLLLAAGRAYSIGDVCLSVWMLFRSSGQLNFFDFFRISKLNQVAYATPHLIL